MNITRKFERIMTYLLGTWQIIDGLITILFYGLYQQGQFVNNLDVSTQEIYALENVFGNIFTFVNIFGMFLIGIGLINIIIAKNYIKDTIVNFKIGLWLLAVGIVSYFIMDILSLILSLSAGVIYLAKNKSIEIYQNNKRNSV